MTPPAQRVQFILGEDHDDSAHQPHPLFSEMEELLQGEDGQMEWKETARYFSKLLSRLGLSNLPKGFLSKNFIPPFGDRKTERLAFEVLLATQKFFSLSVHQGKARKAKSIC